jgi:uncharacterized protein
MSSRLAAVAPRGDAAPPRARRRPGAPRPVDIAVARRMAVALQRLAGPRPAVAADGIMQVARAINCLQLDPISVVAHSHELVLWSRLGAYDRAALDRLLWSERRLFEYWAHGASIVLIEDYPIHRRLMRWYRTGGTVRSRRVLEWVENNRALRRSILSRLRRDGPLPTRSLEDTSDVGWRSGGWTNERNVDQMLDALWTQGLVMIAARQGGRKLWDLAERCLPDSTPRDRLGDVQTTRRAAELSLRSLGVATTKNIRDNFTVGLYPGLERVLADLERRGSIIRISVIDAGVPLPGAWFVHGDDVELLDRIEAGEWEPRTTMLSPFDNLIRDRARMEALFGFDYRMEIYVPKPKRRWGYYVLPVLDGDRLIGRVDPQLDRAGGRLIVNAVHAEDDVPARSGRSVRECLEELAGFLGAAEIEFAGPVPSPWERSLIGRRPRAAAR